jgi:hypothetical protein
MGGFEGDAEVLRYSTRGAGERGSDKSGRKHKS